MNTEVVLLPRDLSPHDLLDRAVVVFDVLRASSTILAALSAGVKEIRLFADVHLARQAAARFGHEAILCGEVKCLPPEGFDLGNSPGAFSESHAGRFVFMSTTNGTRAVLAASNANAVLIGAILNAAAVAEKLCTLGLDTTLLCAGTNGQVAMEDLIGAGAVIAELQRRSVTGLASDKARIARRLFEEVCGNLPSALRETQGGQNVVLAGLETDIDFAARLNHLAVVGVVREGAVVRSH